MPVLDPLLLLVHAYGMHNKMLHPVYESIPDMVDWHTEKLGSAAAFRVDI